MENVSGYGRDMLAYLIGGGAVGMENVSGYGRDMLAYLIGGGARGGCSSPVVVRVVIVTVGSRRRLWVVGIRAPLLLLWWWWTVAVIGGGWWWWILVVVPHCGGPLCCPSASCWSFVVCYVGPWHFRVVFASSLSGKVVPFRRRPIVVFSAIVLIVRRRLEFVR